MHPAALLVIALALATTETSLVIDTTIDLTFKLGEERHDR